VSRLRPQDIKAVLEFLPELYRPRDSKAFERYLVSALPKIIPANITQFHRGDASSFPLQHEPVTHPDEFPLPDILEILETYSHEHPMTSHIVKCPSYNPHRLSNLISRQSFHSTNLYNYLYRHYRVEEMMSLSLSKDSPTEDILALCRDTHFNERERQMYELLRPHLGLALENARALTLVQSELTQLSEAVVSMGRGLVTLNEEGRVTLITPLAFDWLAEYFEQPPRADALPDPVERWFRAEKRKLSAKEDSMPPPLSPLLAERGGKTLTVRLISDVNGDSLLLEETAPRPSAHSIRERFSLTARQAEVLYWVAEGKTNGEIGTILSMSARTVAKHLEHIYQKIGVETRTAAATLVLEPLK